MKAVLILLAMTAPAIAGDLPRLDPEAWCDHVRDFAQSNPDAMRHHCIDNEQQSYEALKDEWPRATEAEQQRAMMKMGTTPAGQSYGYLRAYLGAEFTRDDIQRRVQEQRQRNTFKFD